MTPSFERACAAIDAANAQDSRLLSWEGQKVPQELLYSQRMVAWTRQLKPEASEELLLAVRAQHIQRWKIPRSSHPMDRKGYLLWREALKVMHADMLAEIMAQAGYSDAAAKKAVQVIRRKQMAADPEGQVLEDAACLVFLQYEYADFAAKTADDKVIDILRKTWKKMSPQAHAEALKLTYGAREGALVQKALG